MRRTRDRVSNLQAGLIVISLALLTAYFGYTKSIPFRSHYEVKAAFANANNIRPNAQVRIAGVNVGKVTKVERAGTGAVVTLRIESRGRPLHRDAQVRVRPRIFLEGNFFVDLRPGSPSAPELPDGGTIPVSQTAAPVQLDQILTTLQSDTREDLKVLLREYATALEGPGARGFNRSTRSMESAYRDGALVSQASLGEAEHDLSDYIRDAGAVGAALDRSPERLKSLITDFRITAGAFAREQSSLRAALGELPRTLAAAQPALQALNDAFPPVRRLVVDLRPAVRSSGPAIDAALPFVQQARGLVGERELKGLVADLRPTTPALARLSRRSVPLYRQVRLASSCQNEVILPWTREKISDTTFPAKGPVYQEAVQYLPGIAGESRSGDSNGQWFRVLAVPGNYTYQLSPGVFSSLGSRLSGVNPPPPTSRPPLRPDVPCETQQRADLRTIPDQAPAPVDTSLKTRGAKRRYDRAQARAVTWLRGQLKREGRANLVKAIDVPATLEQVKAAVRARGR